MRQAPVPPNGKSEKVAVLWQFLWLSQPSCRRGDRRKAQKRQASTWLLGQTARRSSRLDVSCFRRAKRQLLKAEIKALSCLGCIFSCHVFIGFC